MLGKAQVMTPEGVRELAFYADNRDLAADWCAGVIGRDEEIIYRDVICVVADDFLDDDGVRFTELLVTGGSAMFVPNVEFTVG